MPHEPKVGELPALTKAQYIDAFAKGVPSATYAAIIAAEREARKDEARWISVDERLPNDWGSTLIWSTGRDGGTDVAWFQFKDGGSDGRKAGNWYDEGEFEVWGVTHWMLLPAPPTALQAEQPESP